LAKVLDRQSRALRIFEKDAYQILTRYVRVEEASHWRVTPEEALGLTSMALDRLKPDFTNDDDIPFDVVVDTVSDLIRRRAEYGDLI
jgi:hypothetical protein